jgi:hypothetical protein
MLQYFNCVGPNCFIDIKYYYPLQYYCTIAISNRYSSHGCQRKAKIIDCILGFALLNALYQRKRILHISLSNGVGDTKKNRHMRTCIGNCLDKRKLPRRYCNSIIRISPPLFSQHVVLVLLVANLYRLDA